MPIKRKISNNFDAASHSYDNVSYVQKNSAEFLVEKLCNLYPDFAPKTILDLGTGTGYLAEVLLAHYPDSCYTLNDISPSMVYNAQSKFQDYDKFQFSIGDMEKIDFQKHDLIISNFALQWACDLEAALYKFYERANIFAFTCLLEGTFSQWDKIIKNYGLSSVVKKYPTKEDLISFLKRVVDDEVHFYTKDFQLTFSNAREFMLYLKNLGAQTSNTSIPRNIIKSIITQEQQELIITYKIFFGIMKRL